MCVLFVNALCHARVILVQNPFFIIVIVIIVVIRCCSVALPRFCHFPLQPRHTRQHKLSPFMPVHTIVSYGHRKGFSSLCCNWMNDCYWWHVDIASLHFITARWWIDMLRFIASSIVSRSLSLAPHFIRPIFDYKHERKRTSSIEL